MATNRINTRVTNIPSLNPFTIVFADIINNGIPKAKRINPITRKKPKVYFQ